MASGDMSGVNARHLRKLRQILVAPNRRLICRGFDSIFKGRPTRPVGSFGIRKNHCRFGGLPLTAKEMATMARMHNPPHPGEIIRDQCLEPLGRSVTDAAVGLGVTRKALSELLNGHAGISPEMALRLERAFDSTAETPGYGCSSSMTYGMPSSAPGISTSPGSPSFLHQRRVNYPTRVYARHRPPGCASCSPNGGPTSAQNSATEAEVRANGVSVQDRTHASSEGGATARQSASASPLSVCWPG